jgi:hypothetical protein
MVAAIFGIAVGSVWLLDVETEVEHGDEKAKTKIVRRRLSGDFSFELDVVFERGRFRLGNQEFAVMFALMSGSICAIDTPDANPYTWILIEPGAANRIVEIDDGGLVILK